MTFKRRRNKNSCRRQLKAGRIQQLKSFVFVSSASSSNLHLAHSVFIQIVFFVSRVLICMMMSGIKTKLINNPSRWGEWSSSLKRLWSPISERTNKQRSFSFATKRQSIWLCNVCTNLIVKPFHKNERESTPFILILNCLADEWWKRKGNWMRENSNNSKSNNKLTILINLSPTRPLSVYLKRHCQPCSYHERFIWIY